MSKLFGSILKKIQKKDPKEPPKALELFTYSHNLIIAPFPSVDLQDSLYDYLQSHYSDHYKIWNLSEYSHDSEVFSGRCVEFLYVGYPNPHLSVFFSIFESISRWLENPQHKAVLHCQDNLARSCMILAGYLVWSGEEKIIMNAFRKILKQGKIAVELLPSQLRYLKYVQELIDKPVPCSRKIRIKKIILDGIPNIENKKGGVRPYIQIYKNSDLIFMSHSKDNPPEWFDQNDLSIVFEVNAEVEEDVLIRCRHLGSDNSTFTIFRVMFHTAFVASEVFRFERSELDGAFVDSRFPELFTLDFFLDFNEETNSHGFVESIFKCHRRVEEVKLDAGSDEEMEEYFRELDNK